MSKCLVDYTYVGYKTLMQINWRIQYFANLIKNLISKRFKESKYFAHLIKNIITKSLCMGTLSYRKCTLGGPSWNIKQESIMYIISTKTPISFEPTTLDLMQIVLFWCWELGYILDKLLNQWKRISFWSKV